MKKKIESNTNKQLDDKIEVARSSQDLSSNSQETGNVCIYRCKPNYVLREIAGESVLVSVGDGVADFCGIVKLNPSAKVIWNTLQKGTTAKELTQILVDTFGISIHQAEKDVEKSLELLINKRMITCE